MIEYPYHRNQISMQLYMNLYSLNHTTNAINYNAACQNNV
jgi:hypothetical protein